MQNPRALYVERLERFQSQANSWSRKNFRISNFRGLSFGISIIAAVVAIVRVSELASLIAVVAGAVFVGLVLFQVRVLKQEALLQNLCHVNQAGLFRLERNWSELHDTGADFADAEHLYSGDLDVFGKGSIYQRISVANTSFGRAALAGFLRNTADVAAASARQKAVAELVPELDFRQRIDAMSRLLRKGKKLEVLPPTPQLLFDWLQEPAVLSKNASLVWAARILPLITLGALFLQAQLSGARYVALVGVLLQFAILGRTAEITSRAFRAVSIQQGAFLNYGEVIGLLETFPAQSPALQAITQRLGAPGQKASQIMQQFARIVGFFELRHNGLVYPFVNTLLLWDVHLTLRLETWKRGQGARIRDWFEAIGEFEALSSLATLAFEEPDFCFPEFCAEPQFVASELSHPMLPSTRRVVNDVRLEHAGEALLVTGSNMSGKSTLLRSMGLAVVLAYAGAPVCARRLQLGPLKLATSMRISDSLDQGVSHFYAELKKLHAVLEASKSGPKVCFLLDEILHGTNSLERQIGARWVIEQLLKNGALGAVSTHDLGLCELPASYDQQVHKVHLRENVQGSEMLFDYKVYPGTLEAGNALRLMRRLGLNVPLAEN